MTASSKNDTAWAVSPLAYTTMLLHAARYGTSVVHGILVGSSATITRAIPVCHEAPTKPLVDMALSLVQASLEDEKIVGWYTAPERLQDERAGPAALRIAAALDKTLGDDAEAVLVVVRNEQITKVLSGGSSSESSGVLNAFGKDFGQQWLEPLSNLTITKESSAAEAAKDAYQQDLDVTDLAKHLEAPDSATEWPFDAAIAKCVDKHC